MRKIAQGMAVTLFALLVSSLAAEYMLRWRADKIAARDHIDQGLFRPDPELGWRLAPLARGRHVTVDFDTVYTTDADGFRSGPGRNDALPATLVLGDSFTFGFGVPDGSTFVDALNASMPTRAWVNGGVPGYSTDQELLLLRGEIARLKPAQVIVTVCLVNDLFDNALPVPLQAPNPKPLFEIQGTNLVLRAPANESPRRSDTSLGAVVAGGTLPWWQRWRLTGALGDALGWGSSDYRGRFVQYADLFGRLTAEMNRICKDSGATLTVGLLPGQALARSDRSASSRYQQALRELCREELQRRGIDSIDMTEALQRGGAGPLYFPNDGHLTERGHAVVAGALARSFGLDAGGEP
jgi:lysophospholipase L1-like esterase